MKSVEVWANIPQYEGYQASTKGRIRSVDRYIVNSNGVHSKVKGRILKPSIRGGYLRVKICSGGEAKLKSVHRLVASTFLNNEDCKPEINHIDGNKKNNSPSNLEWVTSKENYEHAVKIGLINNFTTVRCLETDRVYRSIRRAAAAIGASDSSMGKAIRKNKPFKGLHYKVVLT